MDQARVDEAAKEQTETREGGFFDRVGGEVKGLTGVHLFGNGDTEGYQTGENLGSFAGWFLAPEAKVAKGAQACARGCGRAGRWLTQIFRRKKALSRVDKARIAQRHAATPERAMLLERTLAPDGGLKMSETVAAQLRGQRNMIPTQSILDTIGSGSRIPDPQGIAGQYMFSAPARRGHSGTLDVLVHEPSGEIRHVLYRKGP